MSNINEEAVWRDNVNQVELTDYITGGANGNANLAPKQLADRTQWLKQQIEAVAKRLNLIVLSPADPGAISSINSLYLDKSRTGTGSLVAYAAPNISEPIVYGTRMIRPGISMKSNLNTTDVVRVNIHGLVDKQYYAKVTQQSANPSQSNKKITEYLFTCDTADGYELVYTPALNSNIYDSLFIELWENSDAKSFENRLGCYVMRSPAYANNSYTIDVSIIFQNGAISEQVMDKIKNSIVIQANKPINDTLEYYLYQVVNDYPEMLPPDETRPAGTPVDVIHGSIEMVDGIAKFDYMPSKDTHAYPITFLYIYRPNEPASLFERGYKFFW